MSKNEEDVKKDKSDKDDKSQPAKVAWTSVEVMRPTQCAVGYLEVGLKMGELRERAKNGELEKYLRSHPIPAVMGPDERMYLTDRHHMGLAMRKLEVEWDESDKGAGRNPYRECCFEIDRDYSDKPDMSMAEFYKKMEAHGLCHPYDGAGKRTGPPPHNLEQLEDDPYRSLAGLARKAGAYQKVDTPYAEFKWADYLRTKVDKSLIAPDTLAQAIHEAVVAAHEPEARGLPGYMGPANAAALATLAQIKERLLAKHGAADEAISPPKPEKSSAQ